jgi:hypothetical protein
MIRIGAELRQATGTAKKVRRLSEIVPVLCGS